MLGQPDGRGADQMSGISLALTGLFERDSGRQSSAHRTEPGCDFLQHGFRPGVDAITSRPVGHYIGEAERRCTTNAVVESSDRFKGKSATRVDGEAAADGRRMPSGSGSRVIQPGIQLGDRRPPAVAGRPIAAGAHPAVAETAHQCEALWSIGRDHEWHARLLGGNSHHARFVGCKPVSVERDRAMALEAQQPVELLDELSEPGVPFARRQSLLAEHEGVESGASRADTEGESTAGDIVESRDVLREGHRVPKVG